MKHSFTHSSLFAALFLSATSLVVGCSGQTLDGGSNASGSSSSSSSGDNGNPPASSTTTTTGSSGDGIPNKPIEGQIAGKPFVPKSIDIQFSKANNQWFLNLRSEELDCGSGKPNEKTGGPDALNVTIGELTPAVGTMAIAYGDGHGATFQVGVFESGGPKPDYKSVDKGTVRLDTWSETAGAMITGALTLTNDESNVAGTFTAKVCPAR